MGTTTEGPAVPLGTDPLLDECRACLEPTGTDGAAVAVLSSKGVPSTLCATDALSSSLEDLQFTLGEGPSVVAMRSSRDVLVANLDGEADSAGTHPVFAAEARAAGVLAVFSFPLLVGVVGVGTLGLYRRRAGELAPDQLREALQTRDRVALRLLDLDHASLGVARPSTYRVVVHQAAGMVSVQLNVSVEEALSRLRAAAYAEELSIESVAADVVERRRRFGDVEGEAR